MVYHIYSYTIYFVNTIYIQIYMVYMNTIYIHIYIFIYIYIKAQMFTDIDIFVTC